ncbi:prolipoprotein diacylglyceryl transferase [Krasilnikoviella flava]|uniref:Phosphatidylglycerol--prolipoprotein diacylglyceryl transferase n=1 Tax=Krasilnikoviella flava TaxID=526729 RepID=A0A1T5JYP2_9MICO|nr:prolipoprotein diacylglyceryl transferase [Krasilnikoviella flava]SKC56358.1 prolipoprotein diacylglyceryl transferase [Krasilnikoviella flava]
MPAAGGVTTSIPSPDPAWSVLELGPLTIHVYALCLLAGIALATWITHRRLVARGADREVTLDIVMWAVPLGIVVARIYHVLTHLGDYSDGTGPWGYWEWVRVWDGGIAIYGALLGGALGVWIGCRRAGLRFWSFADALAPAMLAAQAVGRLGNYVNQELYGAPTTLPWGLEIDGAVAGFPDETLFHPIFLYEMLWNLVGVALLLLVERAVRRRAELRADAVGEPGYGLRWGRMFALYLIWYGLGRSWLEALRIDPTSNAWLGVPANIWTSFVAVALGVALFVVRGRMHPEPETSVYVPGRSARSATSGDAASGDVTPDDTAASDDAGSSSSAAG